MNLPWPVALLLGPLIAGVVWRAGLLTTGGAIAAATIGSATALAGADWMLLLLCFFASSVALGRVGHAAKAARSARILEAARARTAPQVLANGALFGIGAVGAALVPTDSAAHAHLQFGAIGALAAATGDTWATEIGMLSSAPPRSILTGAVVPAGLSGGVTLLGLAATASGAAFLAAIAALCGWPVLLAGTLGGVAGAVGDSVLGASLQARRRLADGTITERRHDDEGQPTQAAGGVAWLDNDGVNALATITGAVVALTIGVVLA